MNFGRTGPSGEVGVRERLRKRFRRSPEPDEVSFEMTRNKGYRGRAKKTRKQNNIMHGSENEAPPQFEMARITDMYGNTYDDTIDQEDACNPAGTGDSHVQVNVSSHRNAVVHNGNTGLVGAKSMTPQELARDPFVLELMQHIADLERLQSSNVRDVAPGSTQVRNALNPVLAMKHVLNPLQRKAKRFKVV